MVHQYDDDGRMYSNCIQQQQQQARMSAYTSVDAVSGHQSSYNYYTDSNSPPLVRQVVQPSSYLSPDGPPSHHIPAPSLQQQYYADFGQHNGNPECLTAAQCGGGPSGGGTGSGTGWGYTSVPETDSTGSPEWPGSGPPTTVSGRTYVDSTVGGQRGAGEDYRQRVHGQLQQQHQMQQHPAVRTPESQYYRQLQTSELHVGKYQSATDSATALSGHQSVSPASGVPGHGSAVKRHLQTSASVESATVAAAARSHHGPNLVPSSPWGHSQQAPFDWMKKQTYPAVTPSGKTRTKDKYRIVYTELQKVELEKEFLFNQYITIQRKAELALSIGLSDRQVKIWFQNRRAKERKSKRKQHDDPASRHGSSGPGGVANSCAPLGATKVGPAHDATSSRSGLRQHPSQQPLHQQQQQQQRCVDVIKMENVGHGAHDLMSAAVMQSTNVFSTN